MWDSREINAYLGGELLGAPEVKAFGCVIDSRQVRAGEIFVALVGEKVDGHDYIEAAWQSGATVVIAEKSRLSGRAEIRVPLDKALILVESSLAALQNLATIRVQQLGAKVVAITGSNGKTTTKDMVAAVLARRYKVHKNRENQNNELGLPLTILNAPQETEILVLEMGMRGLGQIRFLCSIAAPDIAVITNIGPTHMELLGSQENIARAKWELIEALSTSGVAVLNAEDSWSVEMGKRDRHPQKFYGIKGTYRQPDLFAGELRPEGDLGTRFEVHLGAVGSEQSVESTVSVMIPLPGEHNVLDSLAALQVGLLFHISLAEGSQGLSSLELSSMRLEQHPGIRGSVLISDVYNANPVSMQASLKVLSERAERATLAILGDMYELGQASDEGHYAVGKSAAELGISQLIAVGTLAEEIARGAGENGLPAAFVHRCASRADAVALATKILEQSEPGVWVLIKASRGMKMEEVTLALSEGRRI